MHCERKRVVEVQREEGKEGEREREREREKRSQKKSKERKRQRGFICTQQGGVGPNVSFLLFFSPNLFILHF